MASAGNFDTRDIGRSFAIQALDEDLTAIHDFIDKRIISGDYDIEESRYITTIRRSSKLAGVAISILGNATYIPVNLRLENFKYFRIILAGGNFIGFWALGSWSIFGIIDDICGPLTPEEKKLFTNRLNLITKVIAIATGIIVSVTSQGATAYIAWIYNDKIISMPIAIMLSDTWFPFYSTYLSVKTIFKKRSFSLFERKLNQMKSEMISLFEKNRELFIRMKKDEKIAFIKMLERIKNLETPKDRLDAFLPSMLKENPTPVQSKVQKLGRAFFGIIGAYSTLSHLALLGTVSYFGGRMITSSTIGGSIATTLTVLSNIYLDGTIMVTTSQRFFNVLYNFFNRKENPTLSEQLSPKLTYLLKFFGFAVSALTWGPGVVVANDYIEQSELRLALQIAVSFAATLLTSKVIFDIIDNMVEKKIAFMGSAEDYAVLEMNNNLKTLTRVIEKSPLIAFAKFLQTIPPDIIDDFLIKHQISHSELDEYISQKSQPLEEKRPLLV